MPSFVGNTNLLELIGLQDSITDDYVNDADVTVTVYDAAGDAVTAELDMVYVTGSDGNYRAILSDTVELVARQRYVASIMADAGPDRIARWEFRFKPTVRSG